MTIQSGQKIPDKWLRKKCPYDVYMDVLAYKNYNVNISRKNRSIKVKFGTQVK